MKKYAKAPEGCQDRLSSVAHGAGYDRAIGAQSLQRRICVTPTTQKRRLLGSLQQCLLYILPIVLFFSYNPVISLGATTSMNLELSLPLVWLFIFSLLSLPTLPRSFKSLTTIFPKRLRLPFTLLLLAFPIYLSVSILWSPNPLRALLTAGIFWCLIFSILTIPSLMLKNNIKKKIVKIFLISSVIISLFCWLQCILDILNVPREATLLCRGCTYRSFGFPHPNGFAIEPQFMGNLLLAPCFLALFLLFKRGSNNLVIKSNRIPSKDRKLGRTASSVSLDGTLLLFRSNLILITISIFLITTLFLTFSRGAIYAFLLGSFTLIVTNLFQKHHQILWAIPIIIASFLLSLLAQGTFAQLSPTSDTFTSGISKVISQLTLGHINLEHNEEIPDDSNEATEVNESVSGVATEQDCKERQKEQIAQTSSAGVCEDGKETPGNDSEVIEINESASGVASHSLRASNSGLAPVTTGGENRGDTETDSLISTFNGYVPESTEARVSLTNYALSSWQDYKLFGSGLGSSGTILYEKGYISTPKEIVQNEYPTLLLETGIIGCLLLCISLVILAKFIIPKLTPSIRSYLLCLVLAYSATLFFFSGLPNALHIYLLPALLFAIYQKAQNKPN